ncbi:MAG: transporter [Armatimonadetes bacterium]|nr:transporter [Armatimonadota bacterium]
MLALPSMAVAIGLVAGLFYDWSSLPADAAGPKNLYEFLCKNILTEGASRLAPPMMYAVFGAILSQVVMRTGIAQRIIGVAAEYAGDRKGLLAFLITVAVAACFTSVTGLGAVIMLGSLALPILIAAGLSANYSACLMLFAIAIGGVFNPAILGLYKDTLGIPLEVVTNYILVYGALLSLAAMVFLVLGGLRERRQFAWAAVLAEPEPPRRVPALALLTPILPIVLIMAAGYLTGKQAITENAIIPAFLVGIVYGCVTTNPRTALQTMTAATLEGLKDISPVIGLFMGIGMALNAMMAEPTKVVMAPFLGAIIPNSPVGFVVFFTLLAPLALYRGPLNFFGLGAGIAGLILGTGLLPPVAVMAAFLAVGQIQGVCDPTNTHNVWLAQFTKGSTETFLKTTLPYVWAFVLAALCYAVFGAGAVS